MTVTLVNTSRLTYLTLEVSRSSLNLVVGWILSIRKIILREMARAKEEDGDRFSGEMDIQCTIQEEALE